MTAVCSCSDVEYLYVLLRREGSSGGGCVAEVCGDPQVPVLHGMLEAEEMFLLLGWKTKAGIQLALDSCWRTMLGKSLTYVICLVVL